MNDEEFIQQQLSHLTDKELKEKLVRATGRTYRRLDELVQNFFNAPFGKWVEVIDHYGSKNADEFLFNKLMKRMKLEHPNIKIGVKRFDGIYVRRDSKTYNELIREEYNKRFK